VLDKNFILGIFFSFVLFLDFFFALKVFTLHAFFHNIDHEVEKDLLNRLDRVPIVSDHQLLETFLKLLKPN